MLGGTAHSRRQFWPYDFTAPPTSVAITVTALYQPATSSSESCPLLSMLRVPQAGPISKFHLSSMKPTQRQNPDQLTEHFIPDN